MRIVYVCNKQKEKCKSSLGCREYCDHTLSEKYAKYPEHGKFRIFGDTGEGFTLEEIEK